MFEMNPLNLPDAQLQQLIMLIVAGVLGFIIGFVSRKPTILRLEDELANVEQDVNDCYWKVPTAVNAVSPEDEETRALNRIRARAAEINFSRIGVASAAEADDLKVITGVGPFLEKKLHAIGIYTFRQIARFNSEDIDLINDLIEYFPGRIERDNWVEQAAAFAAKK